MYIFLQVTAVFIFAVLVALFLGVVIRNLAAFCSASSLGYQQTSTVDEARFLPHSSASGPDVAKTERG